MSITLLNQPNPSAFNAACSPVWVRASTDATAAAYTITGIADNAGSVQLTVASSAGCVANNVLLIAGGTVDFAYLNGRRNVVTVGVGTITIDLAYIAATTGTKGTATIQLEKWSMGIDNQYDIDGDNTVIATHYVPFLGTTAVKDISKIIQGIFQSVFSLVAGWTSELNKCVFTIESAVYEAALEADYSRSVLDSELVTWYAVRSTSITGRILATGTQLKLLNGTTSYKVHAGTKVIMSMLTSESAVSAYTTHTIGATAYPVTAAFTADNWKGNYVYTTVAASTAIQLYIIDSGSARISEIITVELLGGCASKCYPLYFLNRYGGYDVYEFAEAIEVNNTGNRVEVRGFAAVMGSLIDKDFSTENWQELRLIGRNEPAASVDYLKDLITSKEIYNASGEVVKLLSSSLMFPARENVTPEVTILVSRGVVC